LHEKTLDYALERIEKIYPSLVRKALVTKKQASYWANKDPVFFSLCSNDVAVISVLERLERYSGAMSKPEPHEH
jgi:hypothetical protein